ncbi:lactose-binding lectin l-2-like [Babylonia areolata]|uniref:lactose-binding lectin l-2-like n=1 Tax=Babylonia areolata TaxID=304850 RepID=UPI003FD54D37
MEGALLRLLLFFTFLGLCASRCNSGWSRYGNSCYLYFHEPYTFFEAKVTCDIAQAHLVEIDSEGENNFIKNMGVASHGTGVWLGLEDFQEEGSFQWVNSLTKPTFTKWLPGEPNDAAHTEDCVYMVIDAVGHWSDRSCETRFSFVCETEDAVIEEPEIGK